MENVTEIKKKTKEELIKEHNDLCHELGVAEYTAECHKAKALEIKNRMFRINNEVYELENKSEK